MHTNRSTKDQTESRSFEEVTEVLSEEALNEVVGGVNPQPLPPEHNGLHFTGKFAA
jgi:hypothetical protein